MSLRVQFWGTRGSIPSPGPKTVRYGGNTPCVEVRTADGWLIILDAGTGMRELGRSLLGRANGAPIKGDIFLTHAHWDHIQGIPFFGPIFQRGNHFTIWGSQTLEGSIDRIVRDQMNPVVFPVTFEELDATIDFSYVNDAGRTKNGVCRISPTGQILDFQIERGPGAYRATLNQALDTCQDEAARRFGIAPGDVRVQHAADPGNGSYLVNYQAQMRNGRIGTGVCRVSPTGELEGFQRW